MCQRFHVGKEEELTVRGSPNNGEDPSQIAVLAPQERSMWSQISFENAASFRFSLSNSLPMALFLKRTKLFFPGALVRRKTGMEPDFRENRAQLRFSLLFFLALEHFSRKNREISLSPEILPCLSDAYRMPIGRLSHAYYRGVYAHRPVYSIEVLKIS